ncbi:MAG: hypothetical protein ACKVP4_03060 [Hyphomicrobium sp.]
MDIMLRKSGLRRMSGAERQGLHAPRLEDLANGAKKGASYVRNLLVKLRGSVPASASAESSSDAAGVLQDYARALPNVLQAEPAETVQAPASEIIDVRDLPRFLNALEVAELKAANGEKSAPLRANRLARALAMTDIETRLLRAKIRGQTLRWKWNVESVAYVAALLGIVSLAWASTSLLRSGVKPPHRTPVVEALAQHGDSPLVATTPAPAQPVITAEPAAVAPPTGPDFALEERLRFAVPLDDATRSPLIAASEPALLNGAPVTAPDATVPTPPAETAVVTLRNFPPETSLSAGTRLSDTDWSVAESELSGLVVTLPKASETALKAEIEFVNRNGPANAVSRIEIRQPVVESAKPTAVAPVTAPKVARRRKPAAAAPLVAPVAAPPNASAKPVAPAPGAAAPIAVKPPTAAADAGPPPTPPAPEQKQGLLNGLSILPFWPTPYDPSQPSAGLSADQETLRNLGFAPRE